MKKLLLLPLIFFLAGFGISPALVSFIQKYHPATAVLVSNTQPHKRVVGHTPVRFVPYWIPERLDG